MALATSGRKLVIVESPAKARTISGLLGPDFVVESSIGHVRDLPNNASEVPTRFKGQPWARLGVDVDDGFKPVYVVPASKKAQITKLKALLRDADELYLATDEDREGEAIAWHLLEELKPKVPVRRMVFHEITPEAIAAAVDNPREIDSELVEAQEARRILDRLYGYEVSPVLWKKVMSGTSAGRVQSVAIRLVVDRERERIAFRSARYWDLQATFDAGAGKTPQSFPARLVTIDGHRVAQGRDFGPQGVLRSPETVHLDETAAGLLAQALDGSAFAVTSVEAKPYRRQPYPPFRTTTLQQEASRKFGYGAARTMSIAQRLYENGFITYMRTDSATLSESAVQAARAQVRELYGAEYLPERPRTFTNKVKNAQEAHEAIRPAGESFRTPGQTGLTSDELRLYELIWMRTVASQMRDAEGRSVNVRIQADAATGQVCEFAASGRVILFHGFLRAYVEDADDPSKERDDRETQLPDVSAGDPVSVVAIAAEGHETKPPARYTEATLVRELEEREIGRPSTYASIIGTILGRGYVYKKGTALVPSWLAFAVVRLLERHFGRLVDYDFTARMEDVLDDIASGRRDSTSELEEFYFGSAELEGLSKLVTELGEIDARELSTFEVGDGIVVRVGRYGPYVEAADGVRANVPDDLPPEDLTVDVARELLANPAGKETELGEDPSTGNPIVAKNGRYGPYVTEILPEGAKDKPRTSSLLATMTLDSLTLDDALRLLTLPRSLGSPAGSAEQIVVANGRYGPYIKQGTETRSLGSEDALFTITLDEALALLQQPKTRGRQAAAAPLRELGEDPVSKQPITVKNGRFGPYVTDGEYNATLRRDDTIEDITPQRAAELLAERRARGPAKKATTKTTAKKMAAKSAPKASAAKKAAAKKAATKQVAKKKATAKKTAAKKAATKQVARSRPRRRQPER